MCIPDYTIHTLLGFYKTLTTCTDEQSRKREKVREKKLIFCSTKKGERCSSGYPPAEGRVEHSQRNSSQENYIIFSLETKKRITEEEKGKR